MIPAKVHWLLAGKVKGADATTACGKHFIRVPVGVSAVYHIRAPEGTPLARAHGTAVFLHLVTCEKCRRSFDNR